MSISGNLSIKWEQFSPDDVCKIIKLILDSNKSFKVPPKKTSSKLEDHITNRFCAHLRNNKNRSTHFFCIEPQSDILDDVGELVGRIDLKFISGNEEKVYFSFECKVLRVTRPSGQISASYSEYVKEGMYRYFNGQYAQGLNKGGMLGYVQSHSPDYWAQKASEKINDSPQDYQIFQKGCWINEKILKGLSVCYRSTHHRMLGKSPIAIFHCFLIFI